MVVIFQMASNVSQTCSGPKIQGVKTHQQSYQVGILKEGVNKLLAHSHPSPQKKEQTKHGILFGSFTPTLFEALCVLNCAFSFPILFCFFGDEKIVRVFFQHNRTEAGDFQEVVLIYMVTRRIIDLLAPWVRVS